MAKVATRYVPIETATCFYFGGLIKKVKRDLKRKHPDLHIADFDKVLYKSLRTFKLNEQAFDYMNVESSLGGKRWYVKCPDCEKPRLKLYLPDQHPDRDQIYKCDECHHLKNMSLLLGSTKKYYKIVKPMKQLEKLRGLLLKRNMTPEKAGRYLADYERIEQELASSPDYKLWKFQREHTEGPLIREST